MKNKRKVNVKVVHDNLLIANVQKLNEEDEKQFRLVTEFFKHPPHKEEITTD